MRCKLSIILGIDPGSRFTGYGVIEQQGRKFTYLGSGCIKAIAAGEDLGTRLQTIFCWRFRVNYSIQTRYVCH